MSNTRNARPAPKRTTSTSDAKGREQNGKAKTKRRKMSWKERMISIGAVLAGLVAIVLMVLYIPYIRQGDEMISLMDKFKAWQPLVNLEGTLESKTSSYTVRSEVDNTRDDGLELKQLVEGQFTVMFCGFDEKRSNTDVNMLVMFDIGANKINILQIPRDTFVPDYTSFKAGKFNSVYSMGDSSKEKIQRTVDCVESTFGIPIDRYVTTSCTDIVDIVDLIGGVEIDMPYTINYEPGKTITKGHQTLSGQKAEWMLRYRHGYNEGDIGRMQAQRIFLAAAMQKVADTGTLTMMGYMKKIYDNQYIATDMSLDEMSKISDFAIQVGMEKIAMFMLPGEGYNYLPPGYSKTYSVWSIHKGATIDLLNKEFRPYLQQEMNLPIKELITEGNYKTSIYDNNNADFQSIQDGETFSGK